jgi:hypothetical protein
METETSPTIHRISWWVYAGRDRIRHTATMRGQWSYDATCSCGWDSRTGGCVRSYVQGEVDLHKWQAAQD